MILYPVVWAGKLSPLEQQHVYIKKLTKGGIFGGYKTAWPYFS